MAEPKPATITETQTNLSLPLSIPDQCARVAFVSLLPSAIIWVLILVDSLGWQVPLAEDLLRAFPGLWEMVMLLGFPALGLLLGTVALRAARRQARPAPRTALLAVGGSSLFLALTALITLGQS